MLDLTTIESVSGGVLLLDKPKGRSSFSCVYEVRKRLKIEKVGHAGTLDPFATGLLLIMIGKKWTKQQDRFLASDKEYVATITLGQARTSFDEDGEITDESSYCPKKEEIEFAISQFQGQILQTPPMFSAKKVGGKRLYELARKGIAIEREPQMVQVKTTLLDYSYPNINIHVRCSKGTYIRVIGDEIGKIAGSFGYVSSLRRTKSGIFSVENAISLDDFMSKPISYIHSYILTSDVLVSEEVTD